MSGTVNYRKVVDQLTDVIKELNVPCGAAAPAAPSEETRRADAVGLVKALLHVLEQGGDAAGAASAAAEHGASAQKWGAAFGSWVNNVDWNSVFASLVNGGGLGQIPSTSGTSLPTVAYGLGSSGNNFTMFTGM